MLLEALELLQSAGEDSNTYVTDFNSYKVINILTVYCPLFIATFLLSQEVLGEKIACFPTDNFTDTQAGSLSEYCWNSGFWVGPEVSHIKSLFTQPHRYYAFYLAVQAVLCMSPIIFWNVSTKSCLMAVLRGTEAFLEDLVKLITAGRHTEKPKILEAKVIEQLHQFHEICMMAARDSNLSILLITRQVWEVGMFSSLLWLQFSVYDINADKSFYCSVPGVSEENIICSVPVLDLLDIIWIINVVALTISLSIVIMFIYMEYKAHFGKFQPLFINEMPYGEVDNFNERVNWESNFTKNSYELLTLIYKENATIMTQVYVLKALKPATETSDDSSSESEEESEVKEGEGHKEKKAKSKDMFFASGTKKWMQMAKAARMNKKQKLMEDAQAQQCETEGPPSTLRQRMLSRFS